jgi:O-antigen/teichoic acid export membrane protein
MRLKSFDFSLDQITQGLIVIGSGQVVRLAFGLVSSVLIARALGSSDFGIYGVLAATTAIVSTLADLGLTTTVAQKIGAIWPDKPVEAQARGQVYFWGKVSAGGIVVAAGLLLARPLTQLIFNSTTPGWVLERLSSAAAWMGCCELPGSSNASIWSSSVMPA